MMMFDEIFDMDISRHSPFSILHSPRLERYGAGSTKPVVSMSQTSHEVRPFPKPLAVRNV